MWKSFEYNQDLLLYQVNNNSSKFIKLSRKLSWMLYDIYTYNHSICILCIVIIPTDIQAYYINLGTFQLVTTWVSDNTLKIKTLLGQGTYGQIYNLKHPIIKSPSCISHIIPLCLHNSSTISGTWSSCYVNEPFTCFFICFTRRLNHSYWEWNEC